MLKEIKLEKPLFYSNDYGLRFELGPPELGVWANFDKRKVNTAYFERALETAISIFEAVFAPTDEISIVYQIFSDGRSKIQKGNYLFKQIKDLEKRTVTFTRHRDLYAQDLEYQCQHWRRVTISNIRVEDVNANNILLSLINTDFSFRKPSVRGECFFLNHTKGIVLNPYDDRGMDVVALQKNALQALYKSHHANILKRNRAQVDRVFSDTVFLAT